MTGPRARIEHSLTARTFGRFRDSVCSKGSGEAGLFAACCTSAGGCEGGRAPRWATADMGVTGRGAGERIERGVPIPPSAGAFTAVRREEIEWCLVFSRSSRSSPWILTAESDSLAHGVRNRFQQLS